MSPSDLLAAGFAEPSLPRSNGTPTFESPWQARALAMAVLVVEHTGRPWDDFRHRLIAAIEDDPERPYWDSWVMALDRFLADADLLESYE